MKTAAHDGLPRVSARALAVFAAYSRRYVRRHFHSVRLAENGLPPRDSGRPVVVFLNHAAWWDPLVCLLLAREFFPDRTSRAPIDSAMLRRYAFFARLGFFGLEPATARGARTFLRTATQILASPENMLWLTPQGRFMDVRERPLRLENGLGALACRTPGAAFVPLAIEYAFWTEPRPEILISFGLPIIPEQEKTHEVAAWTGVFTQALTATQDHLAATSCRRDPADWRTLDRGKSGVAAVFDTWRWLRARLLGRKFSPEHHAEAGR